MSEDAELDTLLHEDAAGVYASMEPATRERYRAAVCELASWSGLSSTAIARAAVDFAARAAERGEEATHVGHALLGARRGAFEAHLDCRAPAAERRARCWKKATCSRRLCRRDRAGALQLALLGLEHGLAVAGAGALRFVVCALVAVPVLSLATRIADLALWASAAIEAALPESWRRARRSCSLPHGGRHAGDREQPHRGRSCRSWARSRSTTPAIPTPR